jgi:hypothetical protein
VVILCWSELIHVKLIFNWISLDITIWKFEIFKNSKSRKLLKIIILGFFWIIIPSKLLEIVEHYSNKAIFNWFNPVMILETGDLFICIRNKCCETIEHENFTDSAKIVYLCIFLEYLMKIWILRSTWLVITIRNLCHVTSS